MKTRILITIIFLFCLMNCQKDNNSQNKQEKNSPKYPETENCSCTEKAKKDSVILAYNMAIIEKKDGKYVQFQCVDMERMFLSMDGPDGEYCETSENINCISSKKMEIKLPKDAIFFNATSCEEDWTTQTTQNELIKTLKNKEFEFFELHLNKNRKIEQIDIFIYHPEEDKVTKIEYSKYGGRSGMNERITIAKDSIHYFYKENSSKKIIDTVVANTITDWSEITHSFTLMGIKKLKNGKSKHLLMESMKNSRLLPKEKFTISSIL